MSTRNLHGRAGVAHRVSSSKAEQGKHADQHGQRHLVVVRPHDEDDEPEEDCGQAEKTSRAAPRHEVPAEERDGEHRDERQREADRIVGNQEEKAHEESGR